MVIRHVLVRRGDFSCELCWATHGVRAPNRQTLADLAKYTGARSGAVTLRWGEERRQVPMVHVADCEQGDR